jgi:hypothetical protein
MYISHADLKFVPSRGSKIEIGENLYTIAKVDVEMGEIILHLESPAEGDIL